jgi:hypothetical protein
MRLCSDRHSPKSLVPAFLDMLSALPDNLLVVDPGLLRSLLMSWTSLLLVQALSHGPKVGSNIGDALHGGIVELDQMIFRILRSTVKDGL